MNIRDVMKYVIGMVVTVLLVMPMQSAVAQDTSSGVRAGELTCTTVPNSGHSLLIHSTSDVKCIFQSVANTAERYKGETGVGLGVDLRFDRETTITYAVLSAHSKAGSYTLAGKYSGVGASATAAVGVGVDVLVGGGDGSITLQPLGISSSSGAGATAGVTYLYLEADK